MFPSYLFNDTEKLAVMDGIPKNLKWSVWDRNFYKRMQVIYLRLL